LKANGYSASQEIPLLTWNPNVQLPFSQDSVTGPYSGSYVSSPQLLPYFHKIQVKVKAKVTFSLCLTKHPHMKTYWRNGSIIPRILYLGTRWRWMVSITPRLLYPQGKSLQYPVDRRLGGPQSRSGRGVEEKNSEPLPGFESRSSDCPSRSQSLHRRNVSMRM